MPRYDRLLALGLFALLSTTARAQNLFVGAFNNNSVDQYTPAGSSLGSFVLSGSGGLSQPTSVHYGPDGNLYVASGVVNNGAILKYDGTTGAFLSTVASGLNVPTDFTWDTAGTSLYVVAANARQVDRVQLSNGTVTATYNTGSNTSPWGIALRPNGHFLVSEINNGVLLDFDPAGGSPTTFGTGLGSPHGIAIGPDGRYYTADFTLNNSFLNGSVKVVSTAGGAASVFASGGGLKQAFVPVFDTINGVSTLLVTDGSNNAVRSYDGVTGASAGSFSTVNTLPIGLTVRPSLGPAGTPEPGSTVLLAGCCTALAALRYRRRRR